MQDRRKSARRRSYLGGRIAYGDGRCVIDCLVRNYGEGGVMVDLTSPANTPTSFDLTVADKGTIRARMVWRDATHLGVAFAPDEAPSPLSLSRRLHQLQAQSAALRRQLGRLGGAD
jgi:hypothetical protein